MPPPIDVGCLFIQQVFVKLILSPAMALPSSLAAFFPVSSPSDFSFHHPSPSVFHYDRSLTFFFKNLSSLSSSIGVICYARPPAVILRAFLYNLHAPLILFRVDFCFFTSAKFNPPMRHYDEPIDQTRRNPSYPHFSFSTVTSGPRIFGSHDLIYHIFFLPDHFVPHVRVFLRHSDRNRLQLCAGLPPTQGQIMF